ncbi:hypothetical protein KJ632_01725 [Patescibacteria group bacterium]|nr:hypothetical protein [Patescibacteria group bacterium]
MLKKFSTAQKLEILQKVKKVANKNFLNTQISKSRNIEEKQADDLLKELDNL